jgi:ABC-type nitrate/sulfonate/bicarbonate transport system ATPase subunit
VNYAHTFGERLITINDVSLSYGDKLILRDINLHVDNIIRPNMQQGQVVALLGASGVGKTQLFRIIAGLQQATKGTVLIGENGGTHHGVQTTAKSVCAGDIGVVFQSYPLLKHRTVWSNLKLAASKHGVKDDQVNFYLDRFGMTERKDLYPIQLSGGQRQRVAIIQQMLCSTHFILMDEPFSGLDVKMKAEVCKVIQEVSTVDELNTTILTTHDIDVACKVADTIWILGFEKDGEGNRIPGAIVVKQINLIERGIAWQERPELSPLFQSTVEEITKVFMST